MPVETPSATWILFLSRAVASSAMILPGISGAFILLILGKYRALLESLVIGDWLPLVFVGAGAILGLLLFARVLRWLLHRHHNLTVAALIGLVIGVLRKVWPWKEGLPAAGLEEIHLVEIYVLPLALLGFGLVFLLESQSRKSG